MVAAVLAFVPRRSCHIKNVVLFEGDSVLPPPGCLEPSGWQFLEVDAKATGGPPQELPQGFLGSTIRAISLYPVVVINLAYPILVLSTFSKDASGFARNLPRKSANSAKISEKLEKSVNAQ